MTNMRLGWLDELRGLAALSVVVGHGLGKFNESMYLDIPGVLSRGVQLFYLLSGYILFKLYGHISTKSEYRDFLTRRFFRIAPLFYFMTLLCAWSADPWNVLRHFLILPFGFYKDHQIIGPEWSVFVECWFYVLFPVIAWLYRKAPFHLFLGALALSVGQTLLVYIYITDVPTKVHWYMQPTAQLVFFVAGMILADHQGRTPLFWVGLGGLVLLLIPGLFNFVLLYGSLFCLAALVSGYEFIQKPAWLSKALRWTGERSYSVYLIHYPILLIVERHFSGPVAWVVFITSVLLLSDQTWKWVESPGIAFGRRLKPLAF
jgi:peptidoglycan/LPS O-acetylase OafA/YrhL